ncbi:MAG: hypothetical protein PHP00_07500 [Thiotrichaceae bacterium]|nr:hypothetical protein [Thiotrichaceae bacterium]
MNKITVKNTRDILNTIETTKEYLKVMSEISKTFIQYIECEEDIPLEKIVAAMRLTELEFSILENMRQNNIEKHTEYARINKALIQQLFSEIAVDEVKFVSDTVRLQTIFVNFLSDTAEIEKARQLWSVILENTAFTKHFFFTRRNSFFTDCYALFVERRLNNQSKLDNELRKILLDEEDFSLLYALEKIRNIEKPLMVTTRSHSQDSDSIGSVITEQLIDEMLIANEIDFEIRIDNRRSKTNYISSREEKSNRYRENALLQSRERSKTDYVGSLEQERRDAFGLYLKSKDVLLKSENSSDSDLKKYKELKDKQELLTKTISDAAPSVKKEESSFQKIGNDIWKNQEKKLVKASWDYLVAISNNDKAKQTEIVQDLTVSIITNVMGALGSAAFLYFGIPVSPSSISEAISGTAKALIFGQPPKTKTDLEKILGRFDKIDEKFEKLHSRLDNLQNSLNKNFEHLPEAIALNNQSQKVVVLLQNIENTIITTSNVAQAVQRYVEKTGNPSISLEALLFYRGKVFGQIQEFVQALFGGMTVFNFDFSEYTISIAENLKPDKESLTDKFISFSKKAADDKSTFVYPFHVVCETILESIEIYNKHLLPKIIETDRLVIQALYWSYVLPLDAKKTVYSNQVILKKLQELSLHWGNFGGALYSLSFVLPSACIGKNNLELYANMLKYYNSEEVRFEEFNYTKGFALRLSDNTPLQYNHGNKQLEKAQGIKNNFHPRFLILPSFCETQKNQNNHEYRLHCTNEQRDYTPFAAQFLLGFDDSVNIKVRNKQTINAKVVPLTCQDFDNDFDRLMKTRKKFDVTSKEIMEFNSLTPNQTLKVSCIKDYDNIKYYKLELTTDYLDLTIFQTRLMEASARVTLGFSLPSENSAAQIYFKYEVQGSIQSERVVLSEKLGEDAFTRKVNSIGLLAYCPSSWSSFSSLPISDNFYGLLPFVNQETLLPGAYLVQGCFQKVSYKNENEHLFLFQKDGNLVLYKSESTNLDYDDNYKPVWASDTYRKEDAEAYLRPEMLIMHPSGLLQLHNFSKEEDELNSEDKSFRKKYTLREASKDNNKLSLILTMNGFLRFQNIKGNFVQNLFSRNELKSKEVLLPNDELVYSEDSGVTRLVFQQDGNLVLYYTDNKKQESVIWATNTKGKNALVCKMQGDGNLVIYGYNNEVIWALNNIFRIPQKESFLSFLKLIFDSSTIKPEDIRGTSEGSIQVKHKKLMYCAPFGNWYISTFNG